MNIGGLPATFGSSDGGVDQWSIERFYTGVGSDFIEIPTFC